ncbi:MAG: hypothetical protein R3D89_12135 [Sphingomonadaceae bacterium]
MPVIVSLSPSPRIEIVSRAVAGDGHAREIGDRLRVHEDFDQPRIGRMRARFDLREDELVGVELDAEIGWFAGEAQLDPVIVSLRRSSDPEGRPGDQQFIEIRAPIEDRVRFGQPGLHRNRIVTRFAIERIGSTEPDDEVVTRPALDPVIHAKGTKQTVVVGRSDQVFEPGYDIAGCIAEVGRVPTQVDIDATAEDPM